MFISFTQLFQPPSFLPRISRQVREASRPLSIRFRFRFYAQTWHVFDGVCACSITPSLSRHSSSTRYHSRMPASSVLAVAQTSIRPEIVPHPALTPLLPSPDPTLLHVVIQWRGNDRFPQSTELQKSRISGTRIGFAPYTQWEPIRPLKVKTIMSIPMMTP